MKQLVFDKLQRGWLIWLLFSVVFLTVGLMSSMAAGIPDFQNVWLMLVIVFLWSNLTATELARGYGQVALALPFTTRQIGQVLWFVAVGMPMILLAFSSGLGILILAAHSGFQSGMVLAWLQIVLLGGLLCGSFFWISSGAPLNPSKKWQRSQTYGTVFWLGLIGGGYFLYKCAWGYEIKYLIICLFGLIFTILGLLRAEGMVVDYSEYRRGALPGAKTRGSDKLETGFGGIRLLIIRSLVRLTCVAIVISGGFAGLSLFSTHSRNSSSFSEGIPMSQIWFFCFVIGEVMNLLRHLKFLRTLPLTSKQLAGAILAFTLLPLLISSGINTGIICLVQGLPAGLSLFKTYLLGVAPGSVVVTAAIWHEEKRWGRIVLMVTVFLISAIAPIYQMTTGVWNAGGKDLPGYFVIGYPLVFVILAWFAISHLLEANDTTYRIRPHEVKGFNQMEWS
jgi:hypothetical protein